VKWYRHLFGGEKILPFFRAVKVKVLEKEMRKNRG
jgi:hypothetical protein